MQEFAGFIARKMKINLSKSRSLFYLSPNMGKLIPATVGQAKHPLSTKGDHGREIITVSEPSVTSPETLKETEEVSSKFSLGINHNSRGSYRRTARARVKRTGWVNPRYIQSCRCKPQK